MTTLRFTLAAGLAAAALHAPATANEFRPALERLAEGKIADILADPALVEAIRTQNARTSGLDRDRIEALDADWRAQVGAADAPLIEDVLASPVSETLRAARDAEGGLFTEIFVMDAKGLNVAASDVTSDYWQGDEAKFTESFGAGPGAVHVGAVELDESTQMYQSQVSLAIADPDSGAAIGAATVGVNVEFLE